MAEKNKIEEMVEAALNQKPVKLVAAQDDENVTDDADPELQDRVKKLAANDKTRPSIDHLADAVVMTDDGKLLFVPQVGEKVVIERWCTILKGRPWLDTQVYIVKDIDDDTGDLRLFSIANDQSAMDNFINGSQLGYRYKLPNQKGTIDFMKRGRTVVEKPVKAPTVDADGNPIKKKRGRPPGSKNRPRDVVKAEKAARSLNKRKRKSK